VRLRTAAVLVAAALATVVLVGTGTGAWLLVREHVSRQPEISAYSGGHLTRVGPYLFCNVLDLNDCRRPQEQGELRVNEHDPVQLSVPPEIGRAPWRLLQVYEDPANTRSTFYRPASRLAVTVETVDPQRGRLTGIAVQLLTLAFDPRGELIDVPHAEWSVRMVF
jgi:hypothetical protein